MRHATPLVAVLAVIAACGPARPAGPVEAPSAGLQDRSDRTGPIDQVTASPHEVDLTAPAGLRVVHRGRASAALVGPDRLIVVDGEGALAAIDPEGGALRWRVALPDGAAPYELHGVGDRVLVRAGRTMFHVDADSGAMIAVGSEGCRFVVHERGREVPPSSWASDGSVCASQCQCSLSLLACDDGEMLGTLRSKIDVYACGAEVSMIFCEPRPTLEARARTRALAVIKEGREPALAALDPATSAVIWSRRDLGATARGSGVAVDPSGQLCWVADAEGIDAFSCASGLGRWHARLAPLDHRDATVRSEWRDGGVLIVRSGPRRDRVELRSGDTGELRWRAELGSDERALIVGAPALADPRGLTGLSKLRVVDPIDGSLGPTIALGPGEALTPLADGSIRIAGDRYVDHDRKGAPVGGGAWPGGALIGATSSRLIVRDEATTHVVDRRADRPSWALPGRWALVDAAAIDREALVLLEEGAEGPGRILVLRADASTSRLDP